MKIRLTEQEADLDAILATITHVAFFSNYGPDSESEDLTDKHELGRVVPTKTRILNRCTISFSIPSDTCICPSDTIASCTLNDITLNDASDFNDSDERIQIDYATPIDVKVTGKSGNKLTLASPLITLPTGLTVKVKIGQMALIRNGTNSAGTGTIYAIEDFIRYKDATTPTINLNLTLDISNF